MKKVISYFLVGCTLWLTTSCYGPFNLTSKLHEWNGQVGSKFVNALVFLGLVIIPVYSLFLLGDALIFNTIEFWTGSNPIAMKEGDMEEQFVRRGNELYKITATKNQFVVEALEGKYAGIKEVLKFDPVSEKWIAVSSKGEEITLIDFEKSATGEEYVNVMTPEGMIQIKDVEENYVRAAATNSFNASDYELYNSELVMSAKAE